MGSRAHEPQRDSLEVSEIATPEVPYFDRPLAPAPLPVLAGVVALGIGLLYAAVHISNNDWVMVFAGIGVLVTCTGLLDYAGRRRGKTHPDSRYEALHLPGYKSPLKPFMMIATFVVLLIWAFFTATPAGPSYGSPMPYLLAAGFILFVVPQLLARFEMRRGSSSRSSA